MNSLSSVRDNSGCILFSGFFFFRCFSKGYYFDPIMHDYSVDHANELLSQLQITIKGIDQTVVLFSGAELKEIKLQVQFIRKVNPCIKFQVFLLIKIH